MVKLVNLSFNIFSYNALSYKLIQCTIILAALLLIIAIFWQKSPTYQISPINHYQCEIKKSFVSHKILHALLPIADYAKEFADSLCNNTVIGNQFSHVSVSWQSRSSLTAEDLLKEKYQLIWARKDSLKGMVLHFDNLYKMLIPSQKIQLFWLSHTKISQLNEQFLQDKVIGLIQDQKSYSSYLVPIDSLKKQDINIAKLNIHYYDSYKALYDAFNRHEIDIIPGKNWFGSIIDVEKLTQIPIQHQVDSGELYIAKSINSPEIACGLTAAFKAYSPFLDDHNTQLSIPNYCKE